MDYHDEIMVDWRNDILGKVESFCHSNILNVTPPKFHYCTWYIVLGLGTIATLVSSFLLAEQYSWISNMFGNVAAGLIASFVLLLFTNAKEKNLSYYDHMTPELSGVIHSLEIAFNKLYWEERELRKDKRRFVTDNSKLPILENYRVFSMKVYLTHKVMLDVYRQVLAADKLNYKPLHCSEDMLEKHESQVEEFEKIIALDYSQKIVEKFDEYDASYQTIWGKEMELMRHLKSYVAEMQKNIYFVRFGRKQLNNDERKQGVILMTDYPNYKSPAARQKDRIREDIAAIDKAIESCNPKLILQMHQHIDGKYQACIAGWTQSLYGYVPGYGINYEVLDVDDLIHNLQIMKPKLEGFIEGWNVIATPTATATTVPEINVNTTTNVNITISFEQVRAKIEDMTSLTDEQTKEALAKVSEIEDVVKSGGSKKSKWEKIKPILTWLADKSFDVAMTILPLLLQVQG